MALVELVDRPEAGDAAPRGRASRVGAQSTAATEQPGRAPGFSFRAALRRHVRAPSCSIARHGRNRFSSPAAPATSARTSSSSWREAGYAPVVLDNFSNSTPAVLPRLEALAGRPVPVRHRRRARRRGAARRVPRPPDRRRRPLRGTEGRRRVGGAAARVLRRQRRRHACADRGDGRGRRRDARLQLVGRPSTASPTACPVDRGRAAARRQASTAAPSASSRISCATSRARTRTGGSRSCATSIPPARTRSGMLGEAPRGRPSNLVTVLARVAAGEVGELADLRRRLADRGRHRRARLHARPGSRRGCTSRR